MYLRSGTKNVSYCRIILYNSTAFCTEVMLLHFGWRCNSFLPLNHARETQYNAVHFIYARSFCRLGDECLLLYVKTRSTLFAHFFAVLILRRKKENFKFMTTHHYFSYTGLFSSIEIYSCKSKLCTPDSCACGCACK